MSAVGCSPAVKVVALTNTNIEKHLTWKLRVELLLPQLRAHGIEVESHRLPKDPAERTALFHRLRGFDILWLHRHTFWPSELRQIRPIARHLVFDIDDPVGYASGRLWGWSFSKSLRFKAVLKQSSAVLAASPGLYRLAAAHNNNVHLSWLCADPAMHSMQVHPRAAGEPFRLLWLGHQSTFKYLEQVQPQLEAVGQACRQVTLTVVGHSQLQLQHLPVENIAWSPETEHVALRTCHLGLCPLTNDRWSRAKAALKPLQYLANGMPFLGPGIGVLVDYAGDGQRGILADSPAQWIAAVQSLQADEARRQQMGQAGIEYIDRVHSPDRLGAQVASIFLNLARSRTDLPHGSPAPAAAVAPPAQRASARHGAARAGD